MKTVPVVTEEDLAKAMRDYIGWCPTCGEFTRDCTEPDATGYDCPVCEGNDVCGAEQALIEGRITL